MANDSFLIEQYVFLPKRPGSPLDAVTSVVNAAGDVLEAGDDYSSHDSRIVFPVPESGRYCLRITDKRGAGGPLY